MFSYISNNITFKKYIDRYYHCKNCWEKALHKDKDLFEKHTAPALGYAQKYPMEFEKLQKMKWRHR